MLSKLLTHRRAMSEMAHKVVFIFTSNDKLVNTATKTGWYLPEAAHPYYGLRDAGVEIDFVSENGGNPPLDPDSVYIADSDPVSKRVSRWQRNTVWITEVWL